MNEIDKDRAGDREKSMEAGQAPESGPKGQPGPIGSKGIGTKPPELGKKENKAEHPKKRNGGRGWVRSFFSFLILLVLIIAGAKAYPTGRNWLRRQWTVPIESKMILKSGTYTGTADDENAAFNMKLSYETFIKYGWIRIPILPVSVAVSEVTLNGKPVYLYAGKQWYEIITRQKGKGSIEAKFSMKVREQEGVHSLSFSIPRTTATSAQAEIKGQDLDVDVENSQHKEVTAKGERTIVKVTYPPVDRLSLSWKRALPKLEEKDARLYSETNTLCSILEGILHCKTVARYSILRAWVNQLRLSVPDDVNVLAVAGDRIRDWKVVTQDNQRVLQIEFSYKVQGSYDLTVVYEKPISLDGGTLGIPAIYSLDVEREKGYIGLEALTNVEVLSGKAEDIVEIDVDDLPAALKTMTSRPLILGYKYVEQPYSLALNVKRHEDMSVLSAIADSALYTVMMTSDGRFLNRVFYSLRNNNNQYLTISLPEGSELWNASIAGKPVKAMKGEKGELLIPLMDATRGSGYIGVEVVYAEEGTKPDQTGSGSATVQLPSLYSVPTIHLMCELYLPKEGKYREKDFETDTKPVENFSSVRAIGVAGAPVISSEQASQRLRGEAQQRFQQQVTATGGAPVSVKLPLDGQLFRFEKILVLEEKVKIKFAYTGLGKSSKR